MNIYAGNLSWSMTDEDLNKLFAEFGAVDNAKILREKHTGRSRGFGFVEMPDNEAGQKAISALNETEVSGRKIVVNESHSKPGAGRD